MRDPKLCSGPGAAGPAFDASLTAGQLDLPAGVICTLPGGEIRVSAVAPLLRALGDRDVARSVVLERLLLASKVELDPRAPLDAELALVEDRYGGSSSAYLGALARAGLGRPAARALLADELRREAIRSRFLAPRHGAAAIAAFHSTYAGLQARFVEVMSSIGWLGRLSRGLALETFAPRRIFSLRRSGWVRGLYGRLEFDRSSPRSPSAPFRLRRRAPPS